MDSVISYHTFVDFIDPLSSEFVIYGIGLFYLFGFRSVNGIEYVHIASNADFSIVYAILTSKLTQPPPAYIV